MTSDFAAFSRAPLQVVIGGRQIFLPWRPAAEWALNLERLSILAARFAEPADRDWIAGRMVDDPEVGVQVRAESFRLLAEETGRKWWESGRLLATSGAPDVLGRLTLAGIDPWRVSLGQWCAATYVVCTEHADQKGRLKFDFSLAVPPPGFEDEWDDGADDEAEIAAAVAGLMG